MSSSRKSPEYKGEIAGFPEEVVEKMLAYQIDQGNINGIAAFERDRCAEEEGFAWRDTPEGVDFWREVIYEKNFDHFFSRYPRTEPLYYKGEIKDFPKEVVDKMIERQVEQGSPADVTVFERDKDAAYRGFSWFDTPEGRSFWAEVILKKDFALFFQTYPKQETTTIKQPLNNNLNYETFRVPPAIIRTESLKGHSVQGKSVKAAIASRRIEHRAVSF